MYDRPMARPHRLLALALPLVLGATACGAGGGGDPDGGDGDGGGGRRPHPLYPALDLDTLPGGGGGAIGPYPPPAPPTTSRSVTITSAGAQAGRDLLAACQVAGTAVTVPDAAGRLGVVNLGDVTDCDVALGPEVVIDLLVVGSLPGPMEAPAHRLRLRGGQLGSVMVAPRSRDLIFDGVAINNAVRPPADRSGTGIYLIDDPADPDAGFVDRVAVVGSFVRMVATAPTGGGDTDGCAYLAGRARNVLFAGNNIVTAGNRNSWGFRIGGGDNTLLVDNSVRVSFHKLVRMNDAPVDYVYIKGGTWMREAGVTAGGLELNDAFAQLGDLGTDRVFIHDPAVYLRSAEPVSFGASTGPGQADRSWQARRIAWHARSPAVISDARLQDLAAGCVASATCDYGAGTHSYVHDDGVDFPPSPWRDLPAFADDDPDHLPIAP